MVVAYLTGAAVLALFFDSFGILFVGVRAAAVTATM